MSDAAPRRRRTALKLNFRSYGIANLGSRTIAVIGLIWLAVGLLASFLPR